MIETLKQCLQCWGVTHVETMFESDGYEIDQCGGIPSYLKEKIDDIDYAILMFTPLFKGMCVIFTCPGGGGTAKFLLLEFHSNIYTALFHIYSGHIVCYKC